MIEKKNQKNSFNEKKNEKNEKNEKNLFDEIFCDENIVKNENDFEILNLIFVEH